MCPVSGNAINSNTQYATARTQRQTQNAAKENFLASIAIAPEITPKAMALRMPATVYITTGCVSANFGEVKNETMFHDPNTKHRIGAVTGLAERNATPLIATVKEAISQTLTLAFDSSIVFKFNTVTLASNIHICDTTKHVEHLRR